MNLKNRFVALVAVASLAIPALAYAKYSKGSSGSRVAISGKAPGAPFTLLLKDRAIKVDDDGTTTTIAIDGKLLQDNADEGTDPDDKDRTMRENHAKDKVFPGGKDKWRIVVNNADIAPSLGKSLKATVFSGWSKDKDGKEIGIPITIDNFRRDGSGKDFKAKGTIKTTLSSLKVEKICIPIFKFCVDDNITIDATIALKE